VTLNLGDLKGSDLNRVVALALTARVGTFQMSMVFV
jgi:hypothetical protein